MKAHHSDTGDSPRLFAPWAESPLAHISAALALVTLVWKTVGLDFLPGWNEMFGGVGAQYPRRVEALAPAWALGYFLMYGVLGTAATLSSVLITRRRGPLSDPMGREVCRYARVHGAFHVIIGTHHILWAVTAGAWGHLTLGQFHVPGLYLIGGVGALGTGLHGLRLLLSSSEDPAANAVRSKIAVDGVSLLTFTSVLVCFPMNLVGTERNLELERITWTAVFVGPAIWLAADLVVSRSGRR